MTVKNQLKIDLLKYPNLILNKWACYNQWFNTCSDCMKWENGELVDTCEDGGEMDTIKDLSSAFDYFFEDFADTAVESSSDFAGDIFMAQNQFAAMETVEKNEENIRNRYMRLKDIVKMLAAYKYRMLDFEGRADDFLPLTDKSIICNLPEEGVNDDWKNACREYYRWLKDHYDELDSSSQKLISNIKTSWLND